MQRRHSDDCVLLAVLRSIADQSTRLAVPYAIRKETLFFNVDAADCFDIDWPEDFNMAEEIWRIRNE